MYLSACLIMVTLNGITGVGSENGLATACVIASRGASICTGDVNKNALDATKQSMSSEAQDRIPSLLLDIADHSNVRGFVDHTIRTVGRVGGFANRLPWEFDNTELAAVVNANIEGTFNCLSEQLKPGILQRGRQP